MKIALVGLAALSLIGAYRAIMTPSYVITSCKWQKYTQTHYACGTIDVFVPPNGIPALQMNELTDEQVEFILRKYK